MTQIDEFNEEKGITNSYELLIEDSRVVFKIRGSIREIREMLSILLVLHL